METMVQNTILRQALPLITEPWHKVPGFGHYGPAPRLSRLAMGGDMQPALWRGPDRARHAGLAVIEQYVGSMSLVSSSSAFLDLPRDFPYAGLLLRFTASVVISGGTTNGVVHDENPMSYLNRIIVDGAGGSTAQQLKNMKGPIAFRVAHLLGGIEPNRQAVVSSGAAATYPVGCIIPVWFTHPGRNVPPELAVKSILDPSEFGKLTLEIQAGAAADFVNGGDRAIAVNTPVVDVYAMKAVNVQIGKTRADRFVESFLMRDALAALATERRLSNAIPVGRPIAYVLLRTTNEASNARTPIDDTLGALKLNISQTQIRRYQNFRELVQRVRERNGVQNASAPSGVTAPFTVDNPAVGYYMIDFLMDGRREGLLDASRFPARGIPIDLLHDVATASARQLDVTIGYMQPGSTS
jgi:hypothetical protein